MIINPRGGAAGVKNPLTKDLDIAAFKIFSTADDMLFEMAPTPKVFAIRQQGGTAIDQFQFGYPGNVGELKETKTNAKLRFTGAGLDIFGPGNQISVSVRGTAGLYSQSGSGDLGFSGGFQFRDLWLNRNIENSTAAGLTILSLTTHKLGFHGKTPVVQAAAPVTLADVITIIKNVGLSAT